MSTSTKIPTMTFRQDDLTTAKHFQLWRPRSEPAAQSSSTNELARSSSQQYVKSNFFVRLRLVTVVHGDLGDVAASYTVNTTDGLDKASLVTLEVSFFTATSAPCRYTKLSFSMRFRTLDILTARSPPNFPLHDKPPHIAASAPWQSERVGSPTSLAPSSHRPGFRRRLNSSDYVNSELPDRLRFHWEDTDRNERSSFPSGESYVGGSQEASTINNAVGWEVETDNPPLTPLQLAPSDKPRPMAYAGSARATFAVLVQRETDALFAADLQLKVGGDVYFGNLGCWGENHAGYIMPGGASIVFDPAAAPVGSAYQRGEEQGEVEVGEVGAWVEARRGRLMGLKGMPAFRPLRNTEVVEEE